MFSRNRSRGRVRPLAIGVVLLAALTTQAFADVSYTYTGNDYTEFSGPGPFTSLDNFVFSFAVPSALAPSTTFFFSNGKNIENPSLVGWESFDGVYSTSSADLQENAFLFGSVSTDTSGKISRWGFVVGIGETPADSETSLAESSCDLAICGDIFGFAPQDFVVAIIGDLPYVAAGSETAGTWTSTAATPEPNPFGLLAFSAGLLILIKLYQRRRC